MKIQEMMKLISFIVSVGLCQGENCKVDTFEDLDKVRKISERKLISPSVHWKITTPIVMSNLAYSLLESYTVLEKCSDRLTKPKRIGEFKNLTKSVLNELGKRLDGLITLEKTSDSATGLRKVVKFLSDLKASRDKRNNFMIREPFRKTKITCMN